MAMTGFEKASLGFDVAGSLASVFGAWYMAREQRKMQERQLAEQKIQTKTALAQSQRNMQYGVDLGEARAARSNVSFAKGLLAQALSAGIMRGAPATWSNIALPTAPTADQITLEGSR